MKFIFGFVFAMLVGSNAVAAEIPLGDFFKDAEFTSVSLSPTGEYMTVSVPVEDRTLLAAFRISDMKLIGKWDYGSNNHIDRVRWVNDERIFMYVTEKTGKFDSRVGMADVYATNVDGTKRTDIPNGGTYQIIDTLREDPGHILVQRSIDSAYLSRMDVGDGSVRTVATAPLRYGSFLVDHDGKLRYAVGQNDKNQTVTLRRDGDDWTVMHTAEMGGAVRYPLTFAADNKNVIFQVSDDGAPSKLVLVDPESGTETPLSSNPNVGPDGFLTSSDQKTLLAVRYIDGLPRYDFIAPDHAESKVYSGLMQAFPDRAVNFRGISDDGRYILVAAYSDVDPGSYYLFDRKTNDAKFLLAARSWIDPAQMSPMKPIAVTARDGTKLYGYLTLPAGSDGKDLPLILHPHGGPQTVRDEWGFNSEVQFLANRGYAILQINFRGSGGYGNAFESAGYRNWGTTMINDMTDAVNWAISEGIADKDRICTYGASYGGYAALQSVVREPTKYQCAIGYVGVYSLPLMFKDGDIPERKSGRQFLARAMPETLAEQQAQSPAYNVDKINVPVMLMTGGKDRRVPMSHFHALNDALTKAGKKPEITIIEKKEGHGFYDFQNQVDLYTQMEAFLDKYIGQKPAVANTGG